MSKRYPGGIIRKTPQTPSQTSAQGIWDMASVTQAVKENTWPIAGVPDPISRSLRFRSSASAYLTRTPTSAGNRQKFTVSVWYKPGGISAGPSNANILNAGGDGSSLLIAGTGAFGATYQDRLLYREAGTSLFYWPMVFRDPSAWYHIVFAMDTTQSTAANRAKLYVNGVDQGAFSGTAITQNTSTSINAATAQYINLFNSSFYHSDLYYAEYYLIDGQQLTASSFGNTNDQTGVWQPIAYTGTYGTNGFYLPFSNTASTTTLGYDFSGNSNNWTPNNISLTSGSTYDSMTDVPTQWIPYNTAGDTGALYRGNYCVFNPLGGPSGALQGTLSNGNLTWTSPATDQRCVLSTMPVNGDSTGQWYCEVTAVSKTSTYWAIGMFPVNINQYSATSAYAQYRSDGAIFVNGSNVATVASYTAGDVIGMTYNASTSQIAWYKNNSLQTTRTVANSAGLLSYFGCGSDSSGGTNVNSINFGQRPFAYAPPSGFKTLNTTNLPTPTIGATASTQAINYMGATTYSGDSTSNRVITTGGGSDFVWIKRRNSSTNNILFDVLRGAGATLYSNLTNAEAANGSYYVQTFGNTSFTLGTGGDAADNITGGTYVAWNWKANGAGVSNTAGSITSTVSANTTAGFSVATFTSPSSGTASFGHGLGVTPSFVIVKSRASGNWICQHTSTGTQYLLLNGTGAATTDSTVWNSAPTSSIVNIGTGFAGTVNYVAYCFAPIAGYSAFGSYTGNGSTDGPFVFTGFRPRYVMTKRSDAVESWRIGDAARSPYNAVVLELFANLSNAEENNSNPIDYLSNGFKIRTSSSSHNASGGTYIYMAFAESPFKYALAR
jgi:hypothetical protein